MSFRLWFKKKKLNYSGMILSFHSYKEWNNLHPGKENICLGYAIVHIERNHAFSFETFFFPMIV